MRRSESLKRKLREVRRRQREARAEGHSDLSAFRIFDVQQRQITKGKSGTLGKVRGKKQEEQLENLVDRFLESDWTTSKGREKIWKKAERTLRDKEGLTRREYLKYIDDLENDIVKQVVESHALTSDQIVAYEKEVSYHNKRVRQEGGAQYVNLSNVIEDAYYHFTEQGINATNDDYMEYISEQLRI